jgi:hypothetical protein
MFPQLFYIIDIFLYDGAITTWTNKKTRKYFFALVAHWNKKTLVSKMLTSLSFAKKNLPL